MTEVDHQGYNEHLTTRVPEFWNKDASVPQPGPEGQEAWGQSGSAERDP